MLICPQCETPMTDSAKGSCGKCKWEKDSVNGIDVFLSPKDKASDIFQKYLSNYEDISVQDLDNAVLDSRYVAHQAQNLFDSISNLRNAHVCDLGCGQGVLSRMLRDGEAASVTSVDISISYLKKLQGESQLYPVLANAENLPFSDEFDIVVSTDVMEHVLNVGSYLYSLNRAIKTGGYSYIRVPYNESLLQYSPHFGCSHQFVHLRGFNRELITNTLESAGFTVRRIFLDGFVFGTPQPFWMRSQRRMDFYEWFKKILMSKVDDVSTVTRWNASLAKIFMRPLEMVVIAEKTKSLKKIENGGFFLD